MNYEEKLAAALSLIEQHNSHNSENKIDVQKFTDALKASGGTADAALKECSWEDLERCGLPRILARATAKIFRSNGDSTHYSRKHVEAMGIEQLLEAYDPLESDNAVGRRLKSISRERRFLVFDANGNVLVEPSAAMLRELRSGLPELERYEWNGTVYPTRRVGDRIDQVFDENPLYPGQPLRSGGVCGITGLNWASISTEARQIIYLAISQTKEASTSNLSDVQLLYSLASNTAELKRKLPKASVKFGELTKVNKLPSLKIQPETVRAGIGEGRRVL